MLQAVKSLFRKKAFIPIYNIHSYLQRSQIYNHFLKALFCCWFFQIRMSSSIKMTYKKKTNRTKQWLRISPWRQGCLQGEADIDNVVPRNHLLFFLCWSPEQCLSRYCILHPFIQWSLWIQYPARGVQWCVNGDCVMPFRVGQGAGRVYSRGLQSACESSTIPGPVFWTPFML